MSKLKRPFESLYELHEIEMSANVLSKVTKCTNDIVLHQFQVPDEWVKVFVLFRS